MAAIARLAVSFSRFSDHLCSYRISPRTSRFIFCNRSLKARVENLNILSRNVRTAISPDPLFLVIPASLFGTSQHVPPSYVGGCRCSSSNRLAEQEVETYSATSSLTRIEAVSQRKSTGGKTRFDIATPLCERPPSSVASLAEVLRWRQQAQELASSVGSEFVDTDGGPEVSDLLRELEWLLDDSVGGCGCWSEKLDFQSSSWKFCSWRDVKEAFNLKLDSNFRIVHETWDELADSGGDISASAFAALSKDRYCDPVTEFATDCGCSCDGIRENLAEMGSYEAFESGAGTGPGSISTSSLSKLTSDNQNPSTPSSIERNNVQLLLRISLPDLDIAWKERIVKRRPFQYVVAAAYWRDFVLSVMEGVLIPRPETEQLVDMAEVAIANDKSLALGVWADLGTGSGAIAVAIARLLQPPGYIVAVDASSTAVAVASRNVGRYSLQDKVKVLQGFWFSPLQDKAGELSGVVSNPPYIPTENLVSLQAEVGQHEPKIALDGGPGGVDDLLEICNGSAIALRSGGFLALETNGGQQAEAIRDYLCDMRVIEKSGRPVPCFHDVKCVKDFAGIARFVTAIRR